MTSYVTKLIAKKLLAENPANKFGYEDPYFESVPATRLDGSTKVRKRRKAIPPGLSDHDAMILTKVKRRAYRLDCMFSLLGFKFGVSSLIAIIPLVGDAFDILLATMVVRTCQQVEGGLPTSLVARMYLTVLIDFLVGLVPFIGDLGDAAYKANTKNAARLEQHLREKGKKTLRNSGQIVPEIDPSDPNQFERFQEQGTTDKNAGSSRRPTESGGRSRRNEPAAPAPAMTRANRGWFSSLRGSRPEDDVERGP